MSTQSDLWKKVYANTPVSKAPMDYANIANSVFMSEYLKTALAHIPRGGSALEAGVGTGHASIWLSRRDVVSFGIDNVPEIVERAKAVNNILGGSAQFAVGDVLDLLNQPASYDVIHHQGLLEHMSTREIQAALAMQLARANWVVFSVPSVFYPFETSIGDKHLMPLEEWRHVLEPFEIEDLRYYGDPQNGGNEHILCVLRGGWSEEQARELIEQANVPYLKGICAIVHTRNEEKNIARCLSALRGWTDQLVVCDMESSDNTVAIAKDFGAEIARHPLIDNFDAARNVSAMRAKYEWVLYIDADEVVPEAMGRALRTLALERGQDFEAVFLPMRHHFAGEWLRSLYPGYTAPRLLKNGKFHFNRRLHSGAIVDGRSIRFPADDPNLTIAHYSYENLSHYLSKLNQYTDGESANMMRDGQHFDWQAAVRHFSHDLSMYYDNGGASRDGVHGFLWSFLSAFYRFEQHAKLYERRYRAGMLTDSERSSIPASAQEILEVALAACREKTVQALPAPPPIQIIDAPDSASVLWAGPLNSPSGYGDESRDLALAALGAGADLACSALSWGSETAQMTAEDAEQVHRISQRSVKPGFLSIVHDFPHRLSPIKNSTVNIGRTIFETDRLPVPAAEACNSMNWIWVSTEFNKKTFSDSGVVQEKIRVVPQCLDVARYRRMINREEVRERLELGDSYTFLSVFDWTLHKGWDVLLSAFLDEFKDRDDARLLLKVWSGNGYSHNDILRQADGFIREKFGAPLSEKRQIRFMFDRLSPDDFVALYQASDCYVLPSRCEGWGRPYMEAMACGLPVIGTNWSGNTEFMNEANSYLVSCDIVPVSEEGYKELPIYRGHRWAEPSSDHLRQTLRKVYEDRIAARDIGKIAAESIAENYSREKVGKIIRGEIERAMDLAKSPRKENSISAAKSVPDASHSRKVKPVRVKWEGEFFQWHSLAHVNREFCIALEKEDNLELSIISAGADQFGPEADPRIASLIERKFAPLSGPADVHVRHFFPPRWQQPEEGRFVLMQPWEYGYIPEEWVAPINQRVSEVWCNTEYVRKTYADSGVDPEKLKLVPLGVDPSVFKPSAPPYVFTTEPGASTLQASNADRFVFLFVGGTLQRKGIDILLDAYTRAFSSIDNVLLVIKDTGTRTVYNGQNDQKRILAMTQDRSRAPIVYIDDDLPASQMAGIYTSANCLVQPYRGEGFCLPALEALACGIPVVVPQGGPTDDFIDESVGWRISAEHLPFSDGQIGPWQCAGPTWMFEVNPDNLARLMRQIALSPDEARKRGAAGAERASTQWTWTNASNIVAERLRQISRMEPNKISSRVEPARPSSSINTGKTSSRPAPKLSLCMIVRDEERVLGDCLTSVKPWFDEIIVVDTGSTDRTIEIAEAAGAKVFHFPWIDDFSAARNESIKHATGDWVMWMDADDTLPAECGQKLHELLAMADNQTVGFLMQVHIPPAPGEYGFTIVDHVKIFRNLPQLRFEGRIHEQILEAINRIGGRVERVPLHVVHSGYDYSPEGQQKKRQRDLVHLEKDLQDRPDHPFVLFNIGMTAYHLKDFEKAEQALRRCLELSKPRESTIRKVYAMLAGCRLERGDSAGAKELVEKGLSLYPHDPELLFRAGIIYGDSGDLQAAERSYLLLLNSHEQDHIDSLDVTMTGFKAHHNLAYIYTRMGQLPAAEQRFKKALEMNNRFVPSWIGLAEVYLAMRRFDDAKKIVSHLRGLDPKVADEFEQRLTSKM